MRHLADFNSRLTAWMQWPVEYLPNAKETNIIRHYQKEILRGHMSVNTAIDRAYGDLHGWNRHPTLCYGRKREVVE